MRLGTKALARIKLSELLNWLRWGSATGVMWECTSEELFRCVTRWEMANPAATPEHYGVNAPMPPEKSEILWQAAYMESAHIRFRCQRCHELFPLHGYRCEKCDAERYLFGEREVYGPRGKGSYNFALEGADGYAIAAFALATRGKTRVVPVPAMAPIE